MTCRCPSLVKGVNHRIIDQYSSPVSWFDTILSLTSMVKRPSSLGIGPVDAWYVLSCWSGKNFELTNKVTVENIVPNDRWYNRICIYFLWTTVYSIIPSARDSQTPLKSISIPGAVQEIVVLCSICPPLPSWRKWQCNDTVLERINYELTEVSARG